MDVASWLHENELGEYSEVFLRFGINGRVLMKGIDDDHLMEMGIASRLQRTKLLAELEYIVQSLSAT